MTHWEGRHTEAVASQENPSVRSSNRNNSGNRNRRNTPAISDITFSNRNKSRGGSDHGSALLARQTGFSSEAGCRICHDEFLIATLENRNRLNSFDLNKTHPSNRNKMGGRRQNSKKLANPHTELARLGGLTRRGGLVEAAGGVGRPIGLGEFDSPEARRGGKEFDAYARAFIRVVADIDHTTFLLLFT
jgi:hypothetical protein